MSMKKVQATKGWTGVRKRPGGAQRRGRLSPAGVFLLAGYLISIAMCLGLFGSLKPIAYTGIGLTSILVLAGTVWRRRPSHLWPWALITGALVLLMGKGVLRHALQTLGDVSANRSLLPDALALPGYLLLTVGLIGFSRWSTWKDRRLGIILDGMIAALALSLLGWIFVLQPFLHQYDSTIAISLVLLAYPTASIFLFVMTLWTALNPAHKHAPALWLLVAAVSGLFLGDVGHMLAEMNAIRLPGNLIDLPYALGYVTAAATALHPSMRTLTERTSRYNTKPMKGRIVTTAIALIVPALIATYRLGASDSDRVVLVTLMLAMTVATILRLVLALRTADRSEQILAFQAYHDSLTGLPNRRRMEEELSDLLEQPAVDNTRVALLYLDLDRFKLVNDTLGHSRGDMLLTQVAKRLRSNVRDTDMVARIGGDEFTIILNYIVSRSHALDIAERILASLRDPFMIDGLSYNVSASIGIAFASRGDTGVTAETLVRYADTAMYHVKHDGRDGVAVFDESMLPRVAELELERDLHYAVGLGQLHLVYQPIVALPSGSVVGMEALVRWTHPRHGSMLPAQFIPLAEECGVINEIGRWVLREGVGQLAAWRRQATEFANLYVSVNLSGIQLYSGDIVERVGDILAIHGLDGRSLCLELTESVLMEDTGAAAATLEELRRLGVRIAIDDFGAEYSSLAYVKQFPATLLKIDRAFVSNLERPNGADTAVVAAIVAMSRALNIATVAEGVESAAQAKRLHDLGCYMGQGYLYSRPVEAQALPMAVASLNAPRLRLVTA